MNDFLAVGACVELTWKQTTIITNQASNNCFESILSSHTWQKHIFSSTRAGVFCLLVPNSYPIQSAFTWLQTAKNDPSHQINGFCRLKFVCWQLQRWRKLLSPLPPPTNTDSLHCAAYIFTPTCCPPRWELLACSCFLWPQRSMLSRPCWCLRRHPWWLLFLQRNRMKNVCYRWCLSLLMISVFGFILTFYACCCRPFYGI